MSGQGAVVRDELIRSALQQTNWDLLACSMPSNVLLLTGYWPAAGHSLAVATREGQILLIVPEDEDEIAEHSWADDIRTYSPIPCDRLTTLEEVVSDTFNKLRTDLGIIADRIGFEQSEMFEPSAYAPNTIRSGAARVLRRAFPAATLAPADELLAEMRARKTPAEIEHIRTACRMTEQAFLLGAGLLRSGSTEFEVATLFRAALSSCSSTFPNVKRCDGFIYCMSGPNSARATGPYSRSHNRKIDDGDVVIVRCQSYADGYWADVARTYHLGPPAEPASRMFHAVCGAREAVLGAIRPGVRGGDLDRLARTSIEAHGLGAAIKHSAGHGAGFGTLDHTARPRLHPRSDDILESGMVLKLELGAYSDEIGGVRNCDMVAVTANGADPLTSFHWSLGELTIAKTINQQKKES